jgi:hypothetical protein
MHEVFDAMPRSGDTRWNTDLNERVKQSTPSLVQVGVPSDRRPALQAARVERALIGVADVKYSAVSAVFAPKVVVRDFVFSWRDDSFGFGRDPPETFIRRVPGRPG